jgi:hypothetical protein
MARRLGYLVGIVLMAGCAMGPSFSQQMDASIGRLTIDRAIQALGPPVYERSTLTFDHDGRLVAWSRQVSE